MSYQARRSALLQAFKAQLIQPYSLLELSLRYELIKDGLNALYIGSTTEEPVEFNKLTVEQFVEICASLLRASLAEEEMQGLISHNCLVQLKELLQKLIADNQHLVEPLSKMLNKEQSIAPALIKALAAEHYRLNENQAITLSNKINYLFFKALSEHNLLLEVPARVLSCQDMFTAPNDRSIEKLRCEFSFSLQEISSYLENLENYSSLEQLYKIDSSFTKAKIAFLEHYDGLLSPDIIEEITDISATELVKKVVAKNGKIKLAQNNARYIMKQKPESLDPFIKELFLNLLWYCSAI